VDQSPQPPPFWPLDAFLSLGVDTGPIIERISRPGSLDPVTSSLALDQSATGSPEPGFFGYRTATSCETENQKPTDVAQLVSFATAWNKRATKQIQKSEVL